MRLATEEPGNLSKFFFDRLYGGWGRLTFLSHTLHKPLSLSAKSVERLDWPHV